MKKDNSSDSFGDYLKLTNDIVFKAYFKDGEKFLIPLLEDFLPLPDNARIIDVKVLNPEMSPDELKKMGGVPGKTFILDLRVTFKRSDAGKDDKPELVNVEMQASHDSYFADRLLAYSSRLYSEQLSAGRTYKDLAPVYSLVFMTDNLNEFSTIQNEYYHVCTIRRTTSPDLVMSRGMCFVIVELKKFRKKQEELQGRREEWSFLVKHSGRMAKKDYKFLEKRGKTMSDAVKHLWDISQNQGLREFLQVQERDRLDRATGEELAMEKGIEKGIEKGRKDNAEKTAISMLGDGIEIDTVKKYTGLSKQDIEKLGTGIK